MIRLTWILVLLLVAAPATAQTKTFVDFTGRADGKYEVILSGGTVSVVPIIVLVPGDVPDQPPPVTTGDLVKLFQTAAQTVNEMEVARNLGALYQGMAQKSRPPSPLYKTPDQLENSVNMGTDIFLMQSTKREAWKSFGDVFNAEWVKVAQQGGGMEDYAKLLDDASQGLLSSAGADNSAFDITAIFKILEILGDPSLNRLQKIIKIIPLIISLFA